jgi:cytochrome c2
LRRLRLPLLLTFAASVGLLAFTGPPRFVLNLVKPVDLTDAPAAGSILVDRYTCRTCHRIGGRGALTAPDLAGVSNRLSPGVLRLWLSNPSAVKGGTSMPNNWLSDPEIEAILAYLRSVP